MTRLYQFHPFPRREPMRKTIGIAVVAALAASAGGMPPTGRGRKPCGQPDRLSTPAADHGDRPPSGIRLPHFVFDIAGFIQSLVECSDSIGKRAGRPRVDAQSPQCRLLCTCGERPSGRTAEHTEKLAPFSSSLSSERRHCIGQRRPLWNGPEFTSGQLSEGLANVSNGSKRESFPSNGLMSAFASCGHGCRSSLAALCQQQTHAPQQTASSFDHLVGGSEHRRRYGEAEAGGSL